MIEVHNEGRVAKPSYAKASEGGLVDTSRFKMLEWRNWYTRVV